MKTTPPRRTPRRYHNGRPWQRLRQGVLAEESNCWLCGGKLDHTLPPRHPLSPSVDMVIPYSRGGSDQDRGNLRAAHYRCNSSRGNRSPRRRRIRLQRW